MQQKLKAHRYRSVDQLTEDINHMYLNAQQFNEVPLHGMVLVPNARCY